MRQVAGSFIQLENLVLCKIGALLDARSGDLGGIRGLGEMVPGQNLKASS